MPKCHWPTCPSEPSDGRLLVFVVDRGRPGTMTLWQSGDGGRTWPESARLLVHVHDERYAGTPDRMSIHWARITA